MKLFLCVAVLSVSGLCLTSHVASAGRLQRWEKECQQAEDQLARARSAYQTGSGCPLVSQDQQRALGEARVAAIKALQKKPGALTQEEAQRLGEYSALYSHLPAPSAQPGGPKVRYIITCVGHRVPAVR